MKTIAIVMGIVLLVGCSSTPEPAPEPIVVDARGELQVKIKSCVLELMDKQAHALDATEGCLRIYQQQKPQQRIMRAKQ